MLTSVDHLVYASPELAHGIDEIEQLLGVRASAGGQHRGLGTHNALIALGPDSYLEIIAPDPGQPRPSAPLWFGLDGLSESRLVTWAAKGTSLGALRDDAVAHGIPLGTVAAASRTRPDGVTLAWRFTDPRAWLSDGIVPFFIDWGQSEHPAQSAARGATLVALRAEHPHANRVELELRQLGLDVPVTDAAQPALIATIDCPRGRVELR